MKKSVVKYLLYICIFLLVVGLTFKTIFNNNDFFSVWQNISLIKIDYLIISFIPVSLYFILQGIYTKKIFNILGQKVSLRKNILYSFVEFFYSGITPSSTGGQPVCLYYMKKDRINLSKSLITMLLCTIYFKLILVILGFLILIFASNIVYSMDKIGIILYFIGLSVDLIMVIFGILLLKRTDLIIKLASKFKRTKLISKAKSYAEETKNIDGKHIELIKVFLLTLLQRIILFSVSFVVYKAFGLTGYSFIEIVVLQIICQVCIEFVPLPGGTGVSEYLINHFYVTIYGVLSTSAMLLVRTFTFFIPLILSLIIIIINSIISLIKTKINRK